MGSTILVDATRDFADQARGLSRVDLVLLTHAHRDATGGLRPLARWLAPRAQSVPMWSAPATIRALSVRHRKLEPLQPEAFRGPRTWRGLDITARVVPHSADCTTLAWRIASGRRAIVYASDVARLDHRLRGLCAGCDLLILDGATWRRRIFTHLEIRTAAVAVARWPVGRVLFTQLGRSTPPHAELDRWLRAVDPRVGAAYDGLAVEV